MMTLNTFYILYYVVNIFITMHYNKYIYIQYYLMRTCNIVKDIMISLLCSYFLSDVLKKSVILYDSYFIIILFYY